MKILRLDSNTFEILKTRPRIYFRIVNLIQEIVHLRGETLNVHRCKKDLGISETKVVVELPRHTEKRSWLCNLRVKTIAIKYSIALHRVRTCPQTMRPSTSDHAGVLPPLTFGQYLPLHPPHGKRYGARSKNVPFSGVLSFVLFCFSRERRVVPSQRPFVSPQFSATFLSVFLGFCTQASFHHPLPPVSVQPAPFLPIQFPNLSSCLPQKITYLKKKNENHWN